MSIVTSPKTPTEEVINFPVELIFKLLDALAEKNYLGTLASFARASKTCAEAARPRIGYRLVDVSYRNLTEISRSLEREWNIYTLQAACENDAVLSFLDTVITKVTILKVEVPEERAKAYERRLWSIVSRGTKIKDLFITVRGLHDRLHMTLLSVPHDATLPPNLDTLIAVSRDQTRQAQSILRSINEAAKLESWTAPLYNPKWRLDRFPNAVAKHTQSGSSAPISPRSSVFKPST